MLAVKISGACVTMSYELPYVTMSFHVFIWQASLIQLQGGWQKNPIEKDKHNLSQLRAACPEDVRLWETSPPLIPKKNDGDIWIPQFLTVLSIDSIDFQSENADETWWNHRLWSDFFMGFSQDFSTKFGFSGGYRSDVLLWGEKWTASAATFPLRSPGRLVKLPQKNWPKMTETPGKLYWWICQSVIVIW